MRVVSLLPSATEILTLIGGEPLLVGKGHECDFPESIGSLPKLTKPRAGVGFKADPETGDSNGSILAPVCDPSAAGHPLYTLDEAALASLRPDLILTQGPGSACSVDPETIGQVADGLSPRPEILSLSPTSVEDMFDDILRVGEAVGLVREARDAVVSLRGRLHTAAERVNPYVDGPRVGFMAWSDPVFIAGHWTVQLIERAGGRHPLNETVPKPGSGAAAGPQQAERTAGKSIAVSNEVFAASLPEFIVIAPCGLTLDEATREGERLMGEPWFAQLPAARAGRVAAVDGSQMFNRPGPRLIDAFEWLAGWLNNRPELIPGNFPWRLIGSAG
ncbi:MAG: iron complex transport system substrate-binding protein [Phycisphaerales bacterium]|jgi:iron complex transport system substrate-binding protein